MSFQGLRRLGPLAPLGTVGAFVVLAALPTTGLSAYYLHITVLAFLYVALGLGLSIVVGLAGLLDLGYVAFYAVGAYTYALLNLHLGIPFFLALPLGGAFASVFAVLIGWPTIRTRGDYLALVTLGFGEMVRLLVRNWDQVTNGPRGLMGIEPPSLGPYPLSTPLAFYYLGLLFAAGTIWLFWRLKHSYAGLHLAAIRDDEDAAAVIGIRPVRWKLYAFAVGAFVAGLAGVFFASWQRFVSPESFTLNESILVLAIVVLGGMGRILQTIGAAIVLVLLPEMLRGFETARLLVLGVALVVVVIVQERIERRRRIPVDEPRFGANDGFGGIPASPDENVRAGQEGGELLRVTDLSKSFGGIKALDNVSLALREGEIVGLVGVNGAGKSTLLTCITGPTQPSNGLIQLRGPGGWRDITRLSVGERARCRIVRTHSQPRLFPSLSTAENVDLGASCHAEPSLWEPVTGRARSGIGFESARLLASVGGPSRTSRAAALTFVEQKLVEFARALATRPVVLLLDEPAAGMEPDGRQRLAKRILAVRGESGTTIVVVEHDLRFLRSIVDRFVVLDGGRIVAVGAPADPAVEACITRVYQGEHEQLETA